MTQLLSSAKSIGPLTLSYVLIKRQIFTVVVMDGGCEVSLIFRKFLTTLHHFRYLDISPIWDNKGSV